MLFFKGEKSNIIVALYRKLIIFAKSNNLIANNE